MNILVISGDFSIGDLSDRLTQEGHSIKIYIEDPYYHKSITGRFERIEDWRAYLSWVGKDGLIIFDTTGFGVLQDELRQKGYSVIGGSEFGDQCEDDRTYGQQILQNAGIHTLPSERFSSFDEAVNFVRTHPKEWVVKHDGHASMTFNYIGELGDGSDVIDILKTYKEKNTTAQCGTIILQERVRGVEIGVGRYFNGTDWVGPIEMNVEHKDLCAGNLGPKTWEMGTLMWFDDNEQNRLFTKTLAKLAPYLREINYRGDVDINCIVNEQGVFPLEWTARFGFPALQLQSVLITSPLGDFLKAVADGKTYNLQYHSGFGVVVLIATPPFPYETNLGINSLQDTKINFQAPLTDTEKKHIHYEDVYIDARGDHRIAGENGFVMHVSGVGKSITEARENTYKLVQKIVVPKMFYRTDIGLSFLEKNQNKLREWGWLS